ncbi:MAG: TIM barrel protein [Rhodopirellula sp.]|nr:TIM barrel protein [Rhodopirellula sp.]
MKTQTDRRHFIQSTGLALAGTALPGLLSGAAASVPDDRIRKAVGWSMIREEVSTEEKFRLLKGAGFDGVEVNTTSITDPKQFIEASQKSGIPIHGLSGAGADLPASIELAAAVGATTVLYVVRADPKTSLLQQYRDSQETIRAAIPTAEKKQIRILIENVWATFLIEPMGMARYIDEFNSPWVQAYFDVGNVMRWGWPQHWIEVLGKRIGKIHIKEYSLKIAMQEGMAKGFNVPIGEGDIDWARVRQGLKDIGFRNWATAEVSGGDREHLAEIARQMNKVLQLA